MVLDNVEEIQAHEADVSLVQPRCTHIRLAPEDVSGRFVTGGKYTVSVAVENGSKEGLAKVEVTVSEQTTKRWVWLRANEKKEVLFAGLTAPRPGTHTVRVGNLTKSLTIEERQ